MVSLLGQNPSTSVALLRKPQPDGVNKQTLYFFGNRQRTLAKESGLGGACSVGAGVADAMIFGGGWCNSSKEQEIAISDGLGAVRRLCSNTASKANPSLRGLVTAGSFQWDHRHLGLTPEKKSPSSTPLTGRRGSEMKVVLTGAMDGNFFQETRCSRKVAITGARKLDMLVCRHSGERRGSGVVVDDCGEVALTPGLRSQGQLGASDKRLRTRRHDATRNARGGSSGQLGRASGRGYGDQAGMRGAGRGV